MTIFTGTGNLFARKTYGHPQSEVLNRVKSKEYVFPQKEMQVKFGWGGYEVDGTPRPLPDPEEFIIQLDRKDIIVSEFSGELDSPSSQLIDKIYDKVFRKTVDDNAGGACILSNLEEVLGITGYESSRKVEIARNFQIQIGYLLSKKRALETGKPMSPKYMGRDNKTYEGQASKEYTMLEFHLDSLTAGGIITSLYEPQKGIYGYADIADVSQYMKDNGLTNIHDVMFQNPKRKSHYGIRLREDVYEHAVGAIDKPLKEKNSNYILSFNEVLDPNKMHLFIINDGFNAGIQTTEQGKFPSYGVFHGVNIENDEGSRSAEKERYFNHVIWDPAVDCLNKPYFPEAPIYCEKKAKLSPSEQIREKKYRNLPQVYYPYIKNGTRLMRASSTTANFDIISYGLHNLL